MHHCVVREDCHHAAADSHATSELLVTNDTVSLLSDSNMSVAAALAAWSAVTQIQSCGDRYSLGCS